MKKINIITLFFSVLIIMIVNSCRRNTPNCHTYYTIKNNTSSAIYFDWDDDSALLQLNHFPGSSPAENECDANAEKEDGNNGTCRESDISYSSTNKLYIFIFDATVIETSPWQTIKQNYLLLKRYGLTKAQLDSANWMINYP